MRVLFTSLRMASHFLPLVPFIEACGRAGHEVGVAAPLELAERARSTGATFFTLGHPGDRNLAPLWQRMRDAPREEAARITIGELFAGALAQAALPDLITCIETWRPSIVIRESQEYAAVVAAEKAGVPHVQVAITARGGAKDIVPLAAPAVDSLGQSLGLRADPQAERLVREPSLTLFPEALEDAEREPPPVSRFKSPRRAAPPLPDWWPGNPADFVYATLGTVAGGMEQARSAYRVVVDAVAPLPVRVLLTIGSDLPLELLGELPPHVHVERFVPQDDVIAHARAVLCHGGSGTVIGALAAGVPMAVNPLFADQARNARRIAELGAGIALPPKNASPDALRRALMDVLASDAQREAAGRVAAEIAALPPIEAAAAEIERLAQHAPS